jgi:hypothetical protein
LLRIRLEYRFYEFLGQRAGQACIIWSLVRPHVITFGTRERIFIEFVDGSSQKDLSREFNSSSYPSNIFNP